MPFNGPDLYLSRYGADLFSGLGYNLIYGNRYAGWFVLGLFAALIILAYLAWREWQKVKKSD